MIKTYVTHFCGVGGACLGLEQAGLECLCAIDWMELATEYRTKNLKNNTICTDIRNYNHSKDEEADLLWTSPPCQTFSTSAREFVIERSKNGISDIRDNLFLASFNYCKQFKPKFFVFENVTGLLTHNSDGFGGGTLRNIISIFKDIGYLVEWNILCSADFGLPQLRNRVFIIGARKDLNISGLIPDDGSDAQGRPTRRTVVLSSVMENGVENNAWSSDTYKTALNKVKRTGVDIEVIMPNDLFPTITCGWGGGATRKKVCICDTTLSGTPFLRHPTIREGSRAQGFPDSWIWPENKTDAWTLIGNAVSPPVAKAIGLHLCKLSDNKKSKSKQTLANTRIASYIKAYRSQEEDENPPTLF